MLAPTLARPLRILLVSSCLACLASGQNRDHPGLVHLGPGAWGTPEEARERGLIEYHGRWLPSELSKTLSKWERSEEKGLSWKDAYKERTKYYRVQTDVPHFLYELEIKPFLDAVGDTYARVFEETFGLEGKAVKNKDLKIYANFEEYSRLEGGDSGKRPRSNPAFIVNGAELVAFYEETDPALFYAAVLHEGAHQFFLSLLPGADLPIWLDEGLATWFEGATYSRATGKLALDGIPSERLLIAQAILRSKDATAEELFMNTPQSDFQATHYALAWSFLHYLLKRPGEDNTEKLARFLREANGSGAKPIAEVFEEATGEDLAVLSRGWREHVLALPAPEGSIQWVALAAEKPTPDVQEGDLVWSLDGCEIYGAAQFEKAWKTRPKDRGVEIVLVRSTPAFTDPYAQRSFVRVSIAPGSPISIRAKGALTRLANLRD